MYTALTTLIDRLDSPALEEADVIPWGCPVPSFGDPITSRVATLGINPSNREFVDERGNELQGTHRRFHTLQSLGLTSWADVDTRHLELILESCQTYFQRNPYDTWFRKLDQIVTATHASFYDAANSACHLDLIPYATSRKWTELAARQRSLLLDIAANALGLLLRDSAITVLILNGRSVVDEFQSVAGITLASIRMPEWSLPRTPKPDVPGFAYTGLASSLAGVELNKDILILGYNHNLQSSFGVTKGVMTAIRDWVAASIR